MMGSSPYSAVLGSLFGIQTVGQGAARPVTERIGSACYTILDWTALPILRRTLFPVLTWSAKAAVKTDAVQNLKGRAAVWAREQTVGQLRATATSQTDPIISELLACLTHLRDKLPEVDEEGFYDVETTYTAEEKGRATTALQNFQENHARILANARYADGRVLRLEANQERNFAELRRKLDIADMNQDTISAELDIAIAFLEPIAASQKGWIAQVKDLAQSIDVAQFLEMMGLPKPDPESSKQVDTATQEAERALLRRVTTEQTSDIAPPEGSFVDAVSAKLDEITDLTIKMTLVRLIFNGKSKVVFSKIYREALEKKSADTSFDTAFFKALEDEFSTSNKDQSIVDRTRHWFHLNISLPFLQFYIGTMVARFKLDLVNFLKKSPEERIDDVFACALLPLKAHMAAFYSFNRELAGKTVTGSIDNANRKYFDALQFDENASMDSILLEFSSFLVDRYAPNISWTEGIGTALDKLQKKIIIPFDKWHAVQACITAVKVIAVWASILTTGVFEWALNKAVKKILRNELKKQIQLNFLKHEGSKSGAHSRYQYLINRFITMKLRHFNANGLAKDKVPQKLRSSPTTQQEMQQVVDELFRNIPLSIATRSADTLGKHFSSDLVEQGKRAGYSFFVDQFTPTVSLEILRGLEHFLYDDVEAGKKLGFLSEFVWFTVNNLTNVMTTEEATETEQAAMIAIETDMHEQLRMTVQSVVNEGVATALDPSKKHQDTTNATLADIERQARGFSLFVMNQSTDDLMVFENAWKGLNEAIFAMLKNTKINKIEQLRRSLLIAFEIATKELSQCITALMKYEKVRVQHQQNLGVLNSLETQIQAAKGREKIAKLSILGEKMWVSPELKEKIGIYKQYLSDYLATPSTKSLVDQERSNAALFEKELIAEKRRLTDAIAAETALIQEQLDKAKAEKGKLDAWIEKLQPIALTTKDVTSPLTRLIKTLNLQGIAQDTAVSAVIQLVRELLNFKEKPYHWNQVLVRAIHASNQHVFR